MLASSKPASRRLAAALAVALATGAVGCVDELPGERGTTSLRVQITDPAELGDEESRLTDEAREVSFQVTAVDETGQVDTTFNRPVHLYVHFLGTLSPDPYRDGTFATVNLTGGQGQGTAMLAIAYGRTLLWAEDVDGDQATYATGVSQDIWFRDPFIEDMNRPPNESSLIALSRSPLEGKQVSFSKSRWPDGVLIVTGVYAQGFTISDVNRLTGETVPYGHALIFTFGRPKYGGRDIQVGDLVEEVSGGVVEFVGQTEVNFPEVLLTGTQAPDLVPEPVEIDPDWLLSPTGETGMINFEKVEAGLVTVANAKRCEFDDDYVTYGQWKVDVGLGCGKPVNVITRGQVADFDPASVPVGATIPRIVGTLQGVNFVGSAIWIIKPRTIADLTL